MSAPEAPRGRTVRAGFCYLPTPDVDGGTVGGRALELPRGYFVSLLIATDHDYTQAAHLATSRLRRCRPGSLNWHWYRAVIAEHERRRHARLTVLPGGDQ